MRKLILFIILRLGPFQLWRFMRRKDIIILSLHGVMSDHEGTRWNPLRSQYAPSSLKKAIGVLQRHYEFVSLGEAVRMLDGSVKMRPNCMVLTFDDGYRNNLTHALPILRSKGIPCTLFVASGHVTRREPFWFDRLDYAIQHADIDGKEVEIAGRKVALSGQSREATRDCFARIRRLAKGAGRRDEEMLRELAQVTDALESDSGLSLMDVFESDDWSALATWHELAELTTDPAVTIGSHTVNHIRIGFVEDDVATRELAESKASIEDAIGRSCDHFCYPDGSVGERSPKLVEQVGYVSAVTTQPGWNSGGADLFQLRRIHLPESDRTDDILFVASGLADFINDVRRRLGGREEA